jgi:hypothetical protein
VHRLSRGAGAGADLMIPPRPWRVSRPPYEFLAYIIDAEGHAVLPAGLAPDLAEWIVRAVNAPPPAA